MNASDQLLMRAQIAAEMELAHGVKADPNVESREYTVPWINDRDPPARGTYMTVCVNGDGAQYVAMHYFSKGEWHSAGPFVRVVKWYWEPKI
jgi:hypothetical protein